MKENRHTRAIPSETIKQAVAKLEEFKALLDPYLTIGLTPKDRQRLPVMGPKSLDFVEAGYEAATNYPIVLPGHLTIEEFSIDFSDARQLYSVQTALETLLQRIADLVMVAGSESLQAALAVYASVKLANNQKVPGAKVLYEKMRDRYPSARRRSTTTDNSVTQDS